MKLYHFYERILCRILFGLLCRVKKEINIEVMLNGKPIHRLCTTPDRHSFNVPIEDQLLAQKTLIELREKAFLEVARKWPITSFI